MKRRRMGILLMALGVLLAVGVGGTVYFMSTRVVGKTQLEMVNVLVATQEIAERTAIQAGSVAVRSIPADAVPAGALVKADQALGKMATTNIYPNEVMMATKLADTSGKSGIAYTLEPGQVVVTFPASDIVGTGAIKAGDSVDILVTMQPPDNTGASTTEVAANQDAVARTVTQVTLQNLKVLAIGQVIPPTGQENGSSSTKKEADQLITFAVTHDDALILKALKDSPDAILEMALRAAGDDQIVTTDPVTIKDLIDKYGLDR